MKRQHGVELFLDNRQVFLLFFASAVILSLVFTLGVVVGKRVERTAAPQPATDPLTMLDQMGGQEQDDNLTFHEALSGESVNNAAASADAQAPATEPVSPEEKASDPSPEKGSAAPAVMARAKPASEAPAEARAPAKPIAQVQQGEGKPSQGKKKQSKQPQGQKKQEKVAATPAADPTAEQLAYTLQLSAFQDRHEAELFMQKLREDHDIQPYMIPTSIPGRGVWYRVRVGSYRTWDEALRAKGDFERRSHQKLIAYVAKK